MCSVNGDMRLDGAGPPPVLMVVAVGGWQGSVPAPFGEVGGRPSEMTADVSQAPAWWSENGVPLRHPSPEPARAGTEDADDLIHCCPGVPGVECSSHHLGRVGALPLDLLHGV